VLLGKDPQLCCIDKIGMIVVKFNKKIIFYHDNYENLRSITQQ